MTATVYLEGLPGAGKTSIMVTLAAALAEDCLAVPETNPSAAERDTLRDRPLDDVTDWYLRRELRRDRLAAHLAPQQRPALAVFDRSYLSVLAYCYATAVTSGESSRYRHALRLFDDHIRAQLTRATVVVLITTTVSTSLRRRRDKMDREFEHQWYRNDFLDALAEFYRRHAPQLTVGLLRRLDTTASPVDRIHTSLLGLLDGDSRPANLDRLASPLVPRLHGHQLRHPGLRGYYETHGGVRVFGQPLGEPIKHHAGTSQFFERHAVLLEDTGTISPFDPAAAIDGGETR
ncbi:MAG: AAA family ATPase [Pseudonocardiaceae bacterium]